MSESILMKRTQIEKEYGVTRYQIEQAVKDGTLEVYQGPLAGRNKLYFRVAVEAWAESLEVPDDDAE